jgi:IPT/TIG domain
MAAAVLFGLHARQLPAQSSPHITAVDPVSGKVNDVVTVTGESLEKTQVTSVYLSNDKDDFKASVVSQDSAKIVMKIPDVKPGGYNVSIQTGNAIFIQPVRFTVQ